MGGRFYITALYVGLSALSFGQSPGGVGSPELWFVTTPVGQKTPDLFYWKDLAGDSVRNLLYTPRASNHGEPFVQSRHSFITLNYNPTLRLSGQEVPKKALLRYSNLTHATILGVFMPRASEIGTDAVLYSLKGRPGQEVLMSKDKLVRSDSTYIDYGRQQGEDLLYTSRKGKDEQTFLSTAPRILTYSKAGKPYHSVWGEPMQAEITTGHAYTPIHADMGANLPSELFGNIVFKGCSPELIVYGRMLSPAERRQVESYLAIKYGITLSGSYLDGKGNLIWDAHENARYHHRISGIMCDSVNNFYQPLSASSYEPSPFSAIANDSYEGADMDNLPTSNRLLTMGCPEHARLQDGSFMIWGDDDGSLTFSVSESDSSLMLMGRRWLIRGTPEARKKERDTFKDMPFYEKPSFIDLSIWGDDTYPYYVWLHHPPLPGGLGGFQWVYRQTGVKIFAKFGSNEDKIQRGDYGYKIDERGNVFTISNGDEGSTPILRLSMGDMIRIVKTRCNLYLRVNGKRSFHADDINIDLSDRNKEWRPFFSIGQSLPLKELDGIEYLGEAFERGYVELSYKHPDTHFLEEIPSDRIFLVLDKSGSGTFRPEDIQLYPCKRKDDARKKLIFEHIPFMGSDNRNRHFTFGYSTSPLCLSVSTKNPGCNNGKDGKDGSVSLRILSGKPTFDYQLYKLFGETDSLVCYASSVDSTFVINGLSSGSYMLKARQSGGTTLGFHDQGYFYHTTNTSMNPEITWRADVQPCTMCTVFIEYAENPRAKSRTKRHVFPKENGIYYTGEYLYGVNNGDQSPYPYAPIHPADSLTIKVKNGMFSCYLNNEYLISYPMPAPGPYRLSVFASHSFVHNTKISGFPDGTTWGQSFGNVIGIMPRQEAVRTYRFSLISPCSDSLIFRRSPREAEPMPAILADMRKFSVIKENATLHYRATLSGVKVSEVSLSVFDVSGKLIHTSIMKGGDTRTSHFALPVRGIYIVKALSSGEEYTQKIIAQ